MDKFFSKQYARRIDDEETNEETNTVENHKKMIQHFLDRRLWQYASGFQ